MTLADVREFIKPFVDNGSCSLPLIDLRIAEIEERLWPEADWRLAHYRVRVLIRNQEFSLPVNVLKICAVNIDGAAATIGSRALEFSSAYAGDIDLVQQSSRNVVDNGESPTQYDIPVLRSTDEAWSEGLRLCAFSTHVDDTAGFVTVRGYGPHNDEVYTTQDGVYSPGERLPINRWHFGVEGQINDMATKSVGSCDFRSISRVYKSVTKAPVTFCAFSPTTGAVYFLSKMEPDVTIPSYRRYRLTGLAAPRVESDHSITKDCATALMLVKVGWKRAVRETDIMYIQNTAAFKFGAQAITFENAGQYDSSIAAWTLAIKTLKTQQQDRDGDISVPMVLDIGEGARMSDVNHGYLV